MSNEISEIIFKIESADPAIWREAISSLKKVDSAQAKRVLMQLITSAPDVGKKYYAKKVLSDITGQGGGDNIQDETSRKENVLENNEKSSQEKEDKILKYLKSDDYETVVKALMYIAKNNLKKYLSEILNMLRPEAHPFVRATLVKAIACLGGKDYLKIIAVYLKDEDSRVRANTIEAIELLNDPGSYQYILPMLNDNDNRVKANALKAMKNLDREKMLSVIKKMLSSSEEYYVISALFVIENLKIKEMNAELEQLAGDEREEVAEKAQELCKKMGISFQTASDSLKNESKVEVKGKIHKIIINRGFVVVSQKGVYIGVLYPDSIKLKIDDYVGVSGKIIKEDGYFFVLPERVGLIQPY
ncbi:MAG: HEAT repeat domain-containing protein [Candidatus Muiribacteriota bacterium]